MTADIESLRATVLATQTLLVTVLKGLFPQDLDARRANVETMREVALDRVEALCPDDVDADRKTMMIVEARRQVASTLSPLAEGRLDTSA